MCATMHLPPVHAMAITVSVLQFIAHAEVLETMQASLATPASHHPGTTRTLRIAARCEQCQTTVSPHSIMTAMGAQHTCGVGVAHCVRRCAMAGH